jgi:hypothetical protein
MDWYWRAKVGEWVTLFSDIASVICVLGIVWNAINILLEYVVFGSGRVIGTNIYRIIGLLLATLAVHEAPKIVNELEPLLRARLL